jgi:hypothetical protein
VVAAVSEANMPAVAAAALITALSTGLGSVPLAFATSARRSWVGVGNIVAAILMVGPALASPAARCFGWLSRKWSQMRFVRRAGENK